MIKPEHIVDDSGTGSVSFTSCPFHPSAQDQYSADLYHFATKEDDYANYFIHVSCRSSDMAFVHTGKEKLPRQASKTPISILLIDFLTTAARAAGRVPQKLTRVPQQKHQRT